MDKPLNLLTISLALLLMISTANAEIVSKAVDYTVDGTELQGFIYYDDAMTGKRPGVLVIHEWWGLNDYPKTRAEMLAKMGYVAFAADMYGKGITTTDPKKAAELSGQVKGKPVMRERVRAGLEQLLKNDYVDPKRVAAIGYCFGGTTVLELAYSGADIAGVVPFHGGLTIPGPDDVIKTRILILHGAADDFIKPKTIKELHETLHERKTDWQMIYYGGAVHAFTNPGADKAGINGVAYDEKADKRSWAHMKLFFDEIFAE